MSILYEPIVKNVGEIKIVGFRVYCEDGDRYIDEIPKASLALDKRKQEICHLIHPVYQIGVFIIETAYIEEEGYWVGFAVHQFVEVPNDMSALTIPPQTYAALTVKGSNDQIRPAYQKLQQWMEQNNYPRLLHKWHVEKYTKWGRKENIEVELLDTTELNEGFHSNY
ncbi:GyrI-like domain-containing protein [Halobacillus sp. Marseille-P3879]|uniref:GyrI-like domain-containing protein n=1 Tax=Halobacillus sp. Marseille-P3879 TaxID=2045014 RepID=UPI000C7E7BF2|nr:GyrI-like domain-containing protein [Halobacillus sp. Marseille-P3879]